MAEHGLTIKQGEEMTRVQVSCIHQSGLLYMVPAEKSWVCSPEHLPAHALAGFLRDLTELQDPRVKQLMQRWGVYFRQLPLDEASEDEAGSTKVRVQGPSHEEGYGCRIAKGR